MKTATTPMTGAAAFTAPPEDGTVVGRDAWEVVAVWLFAYAPLFWYVAMVSAALSAIVKSNSVTVAVVVTVVLGSSEVMVVTKVVVGSLVVVGVSTGAVTVVVKVVEGSSAVMVVVAVIV